MATRICEMCGALIENVGATRKYCDQCLRFRNAHREISKGLVFSNNNCSDCRFFQGGSCSYIFIVGHRRPCPPGWECTVKELRRKKND